MKKALYRIPAACVVLAIITVMYVIWGGYQYQKYVRICRVFDSAVPVDNADALTPAQLKEYDGRLVCLAGRLTVTDTPADPLSGASVPGALLLERQTEMYQYSISGDSVVTAFFDYQQPNVSGKGGEYYENPVFPAELGGMTLLADVRVGPVTLSPSFVRAFDGPYQYIDRAEYVALTPAMSFANDHGLTLQNGVYTNGDPDAPQVGDIRVSYRYVPAAQYDGEMIFFGTLQDGVLDVGEAEENAFMLQHCDSVARARETVASSGADNARGLFIAAGLHAAAAAIVFVVILIKRKREAAQQ